MAVPKSENNYELAVSSDSEKSVMILDDLTKDNNILNDSRGFAGYINLVEEDLYSYPIMNKSVFYLDVDGLKVEKMKNADVSFHPDSSFKNRPLPEVPSTPRLKLPNRRQKSVFTNTITAWTLCIFVFILVLCGVAELGYSIFCYRHSSNSTSSHSAVKNGSGSGGKKSVTAASSGSTTNGTSEVTSKLTRKMALKKCTKKRYVKTTTTEATSVSTEGVGRTTTPAVNNIPEYIMLKIKPKSVNKIYNGWYIVL